jgi:hypothetical protein
MVEEILAQVGFAALVFSIVYYGGLFLSSLIAS